MFGSKNQNQTPPPEWEAGHLALEADADGYSVPSRAFYEQIRVKLAEKIGRTKHANEAKVQINHRDSSVSLRYVITYQRPNSDEQYKEQFVRDVAEAWAKTVDEFSIGRKGTRRVSVEVDPNLEGPIFRSYSKEPSPR